MSTERPYELVHVPPRLHTDFDDKVTGTGDTDEKREQNFLSRALAAYAIHRLTGCSLVDAAAALVDGGGDGGIDAIYYSPANNTLWVVQSKYVADGRGQPSLGDVGKYKAGLENLLQGKLEAFLANEAWKAVIPKVVQHLMTEGLRVKAVLVYSGIVLVEEDRLRMFDDLKNRFSQDDDYLELRTCNLTTVHEWVRGADDQSGVEKVELEILNPGWVRTPYETIYGLVRLADIAKLQHEHGQRLITANIRRYKGETDVNNSILQTLKVEPGFFFYLNNGLTAYCDKFSVDNRDRAEASLKRITAHGFSIVNGAQTLGSIQASCPTGPTNAPEGYAFIKVVSLEKCEDNIGFAKRITKSTNLQNRIQPRDFVALDDQHERIASQLAIDKVYYHYKSGADVPDSDDRNFDISDAATALACSQQDKECGLIATLVGDRAALWSDDKVYIREEDTAPTLTRCEFLFSGSTSARTVWRAVQTRQIVIERIVASAKAESGVRSDFFRYGRWLVLNLVFLRLRPHQGEELFLPTVMAASVTAECIAFAEYMWLHAIETGLVSRKTAMGGMEMYEAPKEFKMVFGDPAECQRLRGGALKKLNEKAAKPAGATEGANL